MFETKDSGVRETFDSGMRRDTQTGKTLFHLVYDGPMLRRWAELLTRGAQKYSEGNWLKAEGPEELRRFKASAARHFFQWMMDERDEDHGAAVMFNINGAEHTRDKMIDAASSEVAAAHSKPPTEDELLDILNEDDRDALRENAKRFRERRLANVPDRCLESLDQDDECMAAWRKADEPEPYDVGMAIAVHGGEARYTVSKQPVPGKYKSAHSEMTWTVSDDGDIGEYDGINWYKSTFSHADFLKEVTKGNILYVQSNAASVAQALTSLLKQRRDDAMQDLGRVFEEQLWEPVWVDYPIPTELRRKPWHVILRNRVTAAVRAKVWQVRIALARKLDPDPCPYC